MDVIATLKSTICVILLLYFNLALLTLTPPHDFPTHPVIYVGPVLIHSMKKLSKIDENQAMYFSLLQSAAVCIVGASPSLIDQSMPPQNWAWLSVPRTIDFDCKPGYPALNNFVLGVVAKGIKTLKLLNDLDF